MQHQILRILDANGNRISEGLRVLEDIARYALEDASISQQLKSIRHQINLYLSNFDIELIANRQAETDIGADFDITNKHPDLCSLIQANAGRAQEAIRVLEEFAKLPDFNQIVSSHDLKNSRYAIYTLEQRILSAISRAEIGKNLSGIYLLIDLEKVPKSDLRTLVNQSLRSGVKVIGIRGKKVVDSKTANLWKEYVKIKKMCHAHNALLILHDQLDLALACHPDGICIEKILTPVSFLRPIFPLDFLIGHNVVAHPFKRLYDEPLDYIINSNTTEHQIQKASKMADSTSNNVTSFRLLLQLSKPFISHESFHKNTTAGVFGYVIDSSILNAKQLQKEMKNITALITKQTLKH